MLSRRKAGPEQATASGAFRDELLDVALLGEEVIRRQADVDVGPGEDFTLVAAAAGRRLVRRFHA
ncbi:MAG TPA: hypothetical protein VMZ92_13035 [Planctomycetota bacterium]|nr:hypothetical protein [Planctomycetota bacterium]